MEGMRDAANEIGVVLYGGETAELGVFVGSEDPNALTKFNWSGSAFGLVSDKQLITGERMQHGDVVIALKENGLRSNGVSAIRKALAMRFGKEWWNNPEAKDAIAQAAAPSVLYDKFLATMNGWFTDDFDPLIDMKCIAHITGGGIPSKFAEDILFSLGFSADLEDLYEPPQIMRDCAEWRGLEGLPVRDYECYETWNGGQGALVVVQASDESEFIRFAKLYGIEAKTCGRIQDKDEPRLTIVSKFREAKLTYKPR
jgi:phosphoribosylformylglycinamidine cyclo-ligase